MTARLIEDMNEEDYLDHPALSRSGMQDILDAPAVFAWKRENPRNDTAAMNLGKLVHALAFDQPHPFCVKDWDGRTKDGKIRAAEVAEQGLLTIDAEDWDIAPKVVEVLREHPIASKLLWPEGGARNEVTAIWTDAETGVELRARFDVLPNPVDGQPYIVPDLKTSLTSRPTTFVKSAAEFGYYLQAAHYVAAIKALGIHPDPEFMFIAVEKGQRRFLSIVGINMLDLQLAERLRRKAIRTYSECVATDTWPGWGDDIAYPDAPNWWRYQAEELTGLHEEMVV
jgi:hypothetical protein